MSLDHIGRRGTKTFSALTFSHPALAMFSWPYISIRGREDGPTLCVTAGMHGSEYAGIEAALSVAHELDPGEVKGHVLIIPVLNQSAFWGHAAHVVPLDGKNPSQVYPGRRDGTVSDVMAACLFDEIFTRCDALVDLHGGDVMERLTPFTIYQGTDDPELEAKGRALAASYGFPVTVRRSKEVLSRPVPGYMTCAAAVCGIPGIVAEAGGEAQVRAEDIDAHITGLHGVFAHLGMIESAVPRCRPRIVEFAFVFAPQDGLFAWTTDIGQEIRVGDKLGNLRDLWGRQLQDLQAPVDGQMLFFNTSRAAKRGDLLFGLGAPSPGV
jgi:uncharacterized protein